MYFTNWPFRVVPERTPDLWADRKKLLENMLSLLEGCSEKKRSSICCVWGYVGAGKSHSLLHFKWLFEKERRISVIYSPLPKQMKRYADLYQHGFFNTINFLSFSDVVADIWKKLNPKGIDTKGEMRALEIVNNEISNNWLDMAQIIMILGRTIALTGSYRDPLCLLSQAWLSGERLSKRELRVLGIASNLVDDSDFVRATRCILRTLTYRGNQCNGYDAVFWMLDDCHFFATIKQASQKNFAIIQQSLRDVFDACPDNLCLILSFASRDVAKFRELLIDDLLNRVTAQVEIAPLTLEDSFDFVLDLINNEKFGKEKAEDQYYPYTEDAIKSIIKYISQEADLTPREIMKHLDEVTTRAEKEIYPKRITQDFVKTVFERVS